MIESFAALRVLEGIGCIEHGADVAVGAPDLQLEFADVAVALEDPLLPGADLFLAISQASPIALTEYKKVLDFGCGCGRLARMFKNWPHELYGCDIDTRHVDWINENLKFMEATYSFVRPPLPYPESSFDAIISVSVFHSP